MLNLKKSQLLVIVITLVCCLINCLTASATTIIKQPIEDPSGIALNSFYHSLTQTMFRDNESGPAITRIIHYGDSHVAADILTAHLRRSFQNNFGDAGTGFLLAGKPWSWYARSGVSSGASIGWRVDGLSQTSQIFDGRLGLAGLSLTTSKAGERAWFNAGGKKFDIYLLEQPEGGIVEIKLDGKFYRRLSLNSQTYQSNYIRVVAETDSAHTIELTTINSGLVRIFGFVIEHNNAGVSYDALGINGMRATRLLNWNWQLVNSNIEHRDPDLIVVAYGSNEVSDPDLDLELYRQDFSTLLKRFHQAAPGASLLVIAPPDRAERVGQRWQTISPMTRLIEAQRQAAFENGAAFWDLFQGMGGNNSINQWVHLHQPLAQPDRVHLTREGYRLVADSLYREMMRGYLSTIWQTSWQNWWPIIRCC